MNTKKLYLFLPLLLALMVGSVGCSKDDEGTSEVTTVNFYGIDIPYTPIDYADLPTWLLIYVSDAIDGRVCVGEKDGKIIYNVYNSLSSSTWGWFYDDEGNHINVRKDEETINTFLKEIKNWRCIYLKEMKL